MRVKASASLLLGAVLLVSTAAAQGPGRPGFGPGRGHMGRGGDFARVVTGAPYSATEVRTFQERLGDGNLINRSSQIIHYRDSQGRTRTEETITSGSSGQTHTRVVISDPVAGQRHELDSATLTVRTIKIRVRNGSAPAQSASGSGRGGVPREAQATHTGRNGSTITRAELGTQVVNGVAATGRQQTEVIPAGKIGNASPITVTRETWLSTELHLPVRVRVVDPQHGSSDMEFTNIVQAEPDSSLFTVPAGYTEKPAGRGGRGPALWRGGQQSGSQQ